MITLTPITDAPTSTPTTTLEAVPPFVPLSDSTPKPLRNHSSWHRNTRNDTEERERHEEEHGEKGKENTVLRKHPSRGQGHVRKKAYSSEGR